LIEMVSDPNYLTAERVAQLLVAAQRQPQLDTLEWQGDDLAPVGPPPPPTPATEASDDPATYDPLRRKIRDRYIGVRFAGLARSGADLQDARRLIKAARLAFEEEHVEGALELLDLGLQQNAREPMLLLAKLEILFLVRATSRYIDGARAFRQAFPDRPQWSDVMRLGRVLAPEEPLFGGAQNERENPYGPWPDTPNWILAPWDLTSEVLAADFHRAMAEERPILLA
jgi:hypothetical protein